MFFPGVTVYTPTYILNQSEVIIMFHSGVGVEVVENKGYMSARVYLPWTYIVSIETRRSIFIELQHLHENGVRPQNSELRFDTQSLHF